MTDVVDAVQVLVVFFVVHVLSLCSHDLQWVGIVKQDTGISGRIYF